MRRVSVLVTVGSLLTALIGCAEMRRDQNAQISAANVAQAGAITQECQGQMANHDLDPIRDKVDLRPLNAGAPPFSTLANNSVPSPEEKLAIAKWATMRDECIRRLNQFWASAPYPPLTGSPAFRDKSLSFDRTAGQQVSLLIVALYEGKVTYSDFAKQRAEIDRQAITASQEWHQALAIAAQQQQAQAAQLAEQRYEAWLQSWTASTAQLRATVQQPIYQVPVPPTTGRVSCRSYQMGDEVHTDCN